MKFILILFIFSISQAHSFERPESVYVYGKNLFVSNMSGPGNLKDGIGWISKLNLNGKVIQEKWIDGLNAPKGLGVFKGSLYTADIDEVVVIDIAKAKTTKIPVPGAKLLNDLDIDANGNLYVSDTFGSKVYRIEAGTNKVEELVVLKEAPNGVLIMGDLLFIAGYGRAKVDASGVEDGSKGGLWSFNLITKELKSILPDVGRIDGIQLLKDKSFVISVKLDEALYWVDLAQGKIVGTLKGSNSLAKFTDVADMGYDPKTNILYIPNTNFHNIQKIQMQQHE